ncbi:MAG: signal peptide peptidase SppA [Deltaproteobacteria bacterium]|nr:signal peptide peptidase SppA [Deltaproteobacteria bacterium]MDQ3301008.1 signal peptide peptidase SppA [Myxococcota bacterium]
MRGASIVTILWFAALAACSNHPSRLDKTVGTVKLDPRATTVANDPWSQLTASASNSVQSGDDGSGGLGGFDIRGMLTKVTENLEKPGPYEAPEKSADFDAEKPHWGVLAVGGDVVEREAFSMSPFGGSSGNELRELVGRLRGLATNPKLTGLVLRVESMGLSLPDLIELRTAMHDFRKAGKSLVCHAEEATNATYLLLTACERIGLAPLGQVAITGPAALPVHIKPLLDKLGVQADFLHVGAYKGAAEPLTRDEPSQETRETIGAILDRHYATTIDIVAQDRKLEPATVKTLVDTALFPSPQAKEAKLVDEVTSFEAFHGAHVKTAAWTKLELDADDDGGKDQLKSMLKIARFLGAVPPEKPMGPHVAVVYALGNIVDGDGDGVLGARQQIASHTLVAALRALTADDSVKAVVLRIDSGGGSAQASELIWEAVGQLKAKKPVIVSMSDVAASGGYYIAAAATKIYALDDTLTGSIGVVGGKIAPAAALAKLGVNTFPMGRGKRATMMASLGPWNAEEKQVIQRSMDDVYKTFVGRVAEGRKLTPEQVQPLAQGRVWTGAKAKELGLVDEIGGLDAALAEAQKLAKVETTAGIEVYPPTATLRDFLQGFAGGVSSGLGANFGLGVDLGFGLDSAFATLHALDPQLARSAEQLVRLVMSFHATRIQTLAILPVIR